MYDDTLPAAWNEAYLQGVAAYPEHSCPHGKGAMIQWAAWHAGWNDADRGLA